MRHFYSAESKAWNVRFWFVQFVSAATLAIWKIRTLVLHRDNKGAILQGAFRIGVHTHNVMIYNIYYSASGMKCRFRVSEKRVMPLQLRRAA